MNRSTPTTGWHPVRALSLLAALWLVSGCSALALLSAASPSAHYERYDGLRYGPAARHRLDLYVPYDARPDAPVVAFFYGGGWKRGQRYKYEFVAAALTQAGYLVAIPDYRHYPKVRFPAFVDDGADAVAWLQARVADYGGDPTRLVLMGHSAGAHIASLIALDPSYLLEAGAEPASVAALVGLSGPYDFLPIESGYLLKVFPEPTRQRSQPIHFVSPEAPPTLLIHGADDKIVSVGNSERLAARLRSHDVPVTLKVYPDVGHARVAVALAPPLDFIAATLEDSIAFIDATVGDTNRQIAAR